MAKGGVNKVIVLGNVGREPETRYLQNGGAVCNFSVATSESWNDKNSGEAKEKTEWHNVVAFRKVAEILSQYVKKGDKIYIEGKLSTSSWEKDGQKHYRTEIVVNDFQLLGSPQQSNGQAKQQHQERKADGFQQPPNQSVPDEGFQDDIPF